ncbi:MAG: transposase [Armatimonadia bacterium]
MPRAARIVAPQYPHHVTQRGNRRANVFFGDGDYQQYLIWLGKYAAAANVKVWAYCLMTNHVHLILVPNDADGLARLLRPLHAHYSQYVNLQQGWRGHLWEQRYYSTVLDDDHLTAAVRYVERNSVRAGLVDRPEEYPWSSGRAHCGLQNCPVLSQDLPLLGLVRNWSEWLAVGDDQAVAADLRARTMRGVPCGSAAFMRQIEALKQELQGKP